MAWGFAIGVAALTATDSKLVLRSLPRTDVASVVGLAIVGAYAAYEIVLFAFTPFLGGAGSFTLAIVGRLGVLSLLWLIGLIAACEVFRLLNPIRRHQAVS